MNNYNLKFISDLDLYNHVKDTVEKYRFQANLNDFKKNLIDPIKLTFDSKVYNQSMKEVIEAEIVRQIDKSNTNHIGYFHQNIFHYIDKGWTVPKEGYDVVNKKQNYYVEIKNKHNTMNSSSSQKTYMRMQNTILKNTSATCLLVEVIAKNSQNIEWKISLDKKSMSNSRIRRVSMDKFYEIVTGDRHAFKNLCEKLPVVIDDIISQAKLESGLNTVVDELMKISPNLLKSLYLISFSQYEGFNNFNV